MYGRMSHPEGGQKSCDKVKEERTVGMGSAITTPMAPHYSSPELVGMCSVVLHVIPNPIAIGSG